MKRILLYSFLAFVLVGLAGCDGFGTENGGDNRNGEGGEQGTESYWMDFSSQPLRA